MAKTGSPEENQNYPIYPCVIDFKTSNKCGSTCSIKANLNHKISHVSLKNDITSKQQYITIYPSGSTGENYITFKGLKYYVSLMTLFYSSVHSKKGYSGSDYETELHITFKRGSDEVILAIPVKASSSNFMETSSIQFFKEIIKPLQPKKKNSTGPIQLSQGILLEELVPEGGYCFYQSKSVKETLQKVNSTNTIVSGLQTVPPTVFYYKNSLTINAEDMEKLQTFKKFTFISNENPKNIGMFVYTPENDFSELSNDKDNEIYIDCSPEMDSSKTTKDNEENSVEKDIGIFQFAMLLIVILLIPPIIAFSNRFRVYGMYDKWGMSTFAFTIGMLILSTALFFNYNPDSQYSTIMTVTIISLIVMLISGTYYIYSLSQT